MPWQKHVHIMYSDRQVHMLSGIISEAPDTASMRRKRARMPKGYFRGAGSSCSII